MTAPLTSIVILARNELAYTRACVESIARHTPEPYELVFVDNGSTDGTLDYLRSLPEAVVIDNDRNLGFGGGCNQGIALSGGDRILLLNNDVVVTAGWLSALHRVLDADPSVGIVGPRSNRVAGSQQVDTVDYDVETLDGLDAWAARWCGQHEGESEPLARLVGFCLLIERAVIDRIGGFDLRYGLGNFEDDDLCMRACVAGFRPRVVHDSWIHHAGSRTFAAEGIDYSATMSENFQRFATAWRLQEADVLAGNAGYHFERVVQRTAFDPARHHAPLIGVPDKQERIDIGDSRNIVLGVCCERLDPTATREQLTRVLTVLGPRDDVTVVVRIDPRDTTSHALLDEIADQVGDAALPDIALVDARDENDTALLRAVDVIVVHGRRRRALAMLARTVGVRVLDVADFASADVLEAAHNSV